MSLKIYKNSTSDWKILHGDDTDVSCCTIIKYGPDLYIMTITYLPEYEENEDVIKLVHSTTINMDKKMFEEHFKLQHGSPMQYISNDCFNWIIAD